MILDKIMDRTYIGLLILGSSILTLYENTIFAAANYTPEEFLEYNFIFYGKDIATYVVVYQLH